MSQAEKVSTTGLNESFWDGLGAEIGGGAPEKKYDLIFYGPENGSETMKMSIPRPRD